MKKCDVNSWDSYGLMILHKWLRRINSDDPIYDILKLDGTLHSQTPDDRHLVEDIKNGYMVRLADKTKLKKKIESDIKRVSAKVAKWRINKCACDNPDCERCLRVHCMNEHCRIHTREKKSAFRKNE